MGAIRRRRLTIARGSAVLVFCTGLLAGTIADQPVPARAGASILAADLHVHGGLPLDATLPPWELQKEAGRRGLDAIAIVGHNHPLAAWYEGLMSGDVIVLPGLEVLNAGQHTIAAGVREWIDWRLPADEAIEAAHRQGGVVIAAHPIRQSWVTENERALGLLDGAEVAHPLVYFEPDGRQELMEFYERARAANPRLAPIGSSDHHGLPDMGVCRTFLIVNERTEAALLDAIRHGRTVAADADGNLTGQPEFVHAVRAHLESLPPITAPRVQRFASLATLLALAALVVLK